MLREAADRNVIDSDALTMLEGVLEVGDLHFCAHVDTIRRDPDGRIRFHYTILDFAARWVAGDPVAASDVSAAVWAPLDALDLDGEPAFLTPPDLPAPSLRWGNW